MKRTRFMVLISILVMVIVVFSVNIPSNKKSVQKIGILAANDLRLSKVEGLKSELQKLGYTEGVDLTYHVEIAENDLNQMRDLGNQLLQEKPDVLVAAGAVEAQVLKELTAESTVQTPVVFMGILSPVDIGLVQDLSQPGGNLTGLNNGHYELTPKRLELLHRLLPKVKRVAVLGDTRVPIFEQIQNELNKVAQTFGLSVNIYTVENSSEIQQAFASIDQEGAEAIILLPGFSWRRALRKS